MEKHVIWETQLSLSKKKKKKKHKAFFENISLANTTPYKNTKNMRDPNHNRSNSF
jgi:hypothetical protein